VRGEECRCEGGDGGSESALVMSGGTCRKEWEVNEEQSYKETRDMQSGVAVKC